MNLCIGPSRTDTESPCQTRRSGKHVSIESPSVSDRTVCGKATRDHNWMIRWSYYSWNMVRLSRELISTFKNHMQGIVILLMQSGMTLFRINQLIWRHQEMVPSRSLFSLVDPLRWSVDYAKQVHTCKVYIYILEQYDRQSSDCPFVTSPLALP